jgi:hypothetical protein
MVFYGRVAENKITIAATFYCRLYFSCSTELVGRLIRAGARVNTIDSVARLSALSYTCIVPPNDKQAVRAREIAEVLLENGAEVRPHFFYFLDYKSADNDLRKYRINLKFPILK